VRGEMKKPFVVNNNLSLGINTKTKTNIKTLINPQSNPPSPPRASDLEEYSIQDCGVPMPNSSDRLALGIFLLTPI